MKMDLVAESFHSDTDQLDNNTSYWFSIYLLYNGENTDFDIHLISNYLVTALFFGV